MRQLFQKAKHTSVIPWFLQESSKGDLQTSLNHPVLGEGPFFVDHVWYEWEFSGMLQLARIALFQGRGTVCAPVQAILSPGISSGTMLGVQ